MQPERGDAVVVNWRAAVAIEGTKANFKLKPQMGHASIPMLKSMFRKIGLYMVMAEHTFFLKGNVVGEAPTAS
jgi:hypothetical protein